MEAPNIKALTREEFAKVVMDMILETPSAKFLVVMDEPGKGVATLTSDYSAAWFIGIMEMLKDMLEMRRSEFKQTINSPESMGRFVNRVNESLKTDGKAN